MKIRFGWLFVLCLVISSACARPATVSLTSTASPSLTRRLLPSLTTTAPYAVTLTPRPTSTSSPRDYAADSCWKPPGYRDDDRMTQFSPDRQWAAMICIEPGDLTLDWMPSFTVTKLDGSQDWHLTFHELTGKLPCIKYKTQWNDWGCFWGMIYVNRWSDDSRYLMLTIDFVVDRWVYSVYYFGLYRFDVLTGEISPWLPLTFTQYFFAFSPDGKYLAYATAIDGFHLHINAIDSGRVSEIDLPGSPNYISSIVWSLDSQIITVSGLYGNWRQDTGASALFAISAGTGQLDLLLPYDSGVRYPVEWVSNTILIVLVDRTEYQYDINIHDIVPTSAP